MFNVNYLAVNIKFLIFYACDLGFIEGSWLGVGLISGLGFGFRLFFEVLVFGLKELIYNIKDLVFNFSVYVFWALVLAFSV